MEPKLRLVTPAAQGDSNAELENEAYWKRTSGYDDQAVLRGREATGNVVYAQQEQLLSRLVETELARLDRPLEILEFGCGFGRHAGYLAGIQGARYHGYDFSEEMLAPLRDQPPPGVSPAQIFGGPDVETAVGDSRFDVIFTVSVLIHNPPEQVTQIIGRLSRLLREDGLLVLIENTVVPFGVHENSWHGGCWLHSFADHLPEGWDLHLIPRRMETHDVYVCRRGIAGERRFFLTEDIADARAPTRPISRAELDLMGLRKLQGWSWHASQAMRTGAEAALRNRIVELEERLEAERARTRRGAQLATLSDDLAALRASVPSGEPPSRPLFEARPRAAEAPLLVDATLDTTWAQRDTRLSRVLHVFHQEWFGIRAAAGYFPGRKLAITANRPLTSAEVRECVELATSGLTKTIVFHGFSPNTRALIRLARKVGGRSLRLVALWHGSTAQFHFQSELDSFTELIDLKRRGILDAVGCVKPQMQLLSSELWTETILNAPPLVEPSMVSPAFGAPTDAAFVPTPNNLWKNFYTNVFAAASAPGMKKVLVTTTFPRNPLVPLPAKIVQMSHLSRGEMFDVISRVDVMLNVTLAECQPMTALEGLGHGVPCLTGPLSLGPGLDDHPFQMLMQVPGTCSLADIRDQLARVLELRRKQPAEMRQMMDDFTQVLSNQMLQRMWDFCQV